MPPVCRQHAAAARGGAGNGWAVGGMGAGRSSGGSAPGLSSLNHAGRPDRLMDETAIPALWVEQHVVAAVSSRHTQRGGALPLWPGHGLRRARAHQGGLADCVANEAVAAEHQDPGHSGGGGRVGRRGRVRTVAVVAAMGRGDGAVRRAPRRLAGEGSPPERRRGSCCGSVEHCGSNGQCRRSSWCRVVKGPRQLVYTTIQYLSRARAGPRGINIQ